MAWSARRLKAQATDTVGDLQELTVYSQSSRRRADRRRRRFESFCAAVDQWRAAGGRRVFRPAQVYRLSHDEIAEVLGVSHASIEKHVAKACPLPRLSASGRLAGTYRAAPRARYRQALARPWRCE